MIAHTLRESKLQGTKNFCFVLANSTGTLAPVVRYDEFGLPSSSQPWVPQAMAWLILRNRHSRYADLVPSALTVRGGPAPAGCTVIDLGKALSE